MANIIEWQTDESESNDPGPAGAEPQDQDDSELEDDGTIARVKANENAVITKLAEPLNDTNCVTISPSFTLTVLWMTHTGLSDC